MRGYNTCAYAPARIAHKKRDFISYLHMHKAMMR